MEQHQNQDRAFPSFRYGNDDSLSFFVREIRKFPMLEAGDEYQLARDWHEKNDQKAMDRLMGSHLRLVWKIAQGYRNYGIPLQDLVAEGNIGMMQALRKFKPEKGFRFSTYATWWIRAAIQDYVLKNWSMVKIGTTASQRKLFFNLRKTRSKLEEGEEHLTDENLEKISSELDVSHEDVIEMTQRMQARDFSLNASIGEAGNGEWMDWLEDPEENHEHALIQRREMEYRQKIMEKALACLNQREYEILHSRRLKEPPRTLEELSSTIGVSGERIRQLEVIAFRKLQEEVRKLSGQNNGMAVSGQ